MNPDNADKMFVASNSIQRDMFEIARNSRVLSPDNEAQVKKSAGVILILLQTNIDKYLVTYEIDFSPVVPFVQNRSPSALVERLIAEGGDWRYSVNSALDDAKRRLLAVIADIRSSCPADADIASGYYDNFTTIADRYVSKN